MVYRVVIDTSSARREAANIRATFERELKQIKLGSLDTSAFKTAQTDALGLRDAVKQIEAETKSTQNALDKLKVPAAGSGISTPSVGSGGATSGFGGFVSGQAASISNEVKSLALSYVGLQAAIGAVRGVVELAELGTQAARAGKSFEILSGSAERAQTNVIAIQRASSGTISSMTAMQLGTQAAALGLASTTAEFERLVTAARLVVQVSPTIKDLGDAMGQLALFASNETSYMRADQLGLAASEVKDRIKDLQSENENLTGSQAKLEASLQIITEKFGALTSTTEAQATGIERVRVAWTEFQIALSGGTGPVQGFANEVADTMNRMTVLFGGTSAPIGILIDNLQKMHEESKKNAEASFWKKDPLMEDPTRLATVTQSLNSGVDAVTQGIPGSGAILGQIQEIAVSVDRWNNVSDEQLAKLRELNTELNNLIVNGGKAEAAAATAEQAAALAAEQRANSIIEQSGPVGDAVTSSATKALEVLGLQPTLDLLKQQKAQVDAAIQELINSSVTDPAEINLRLTEIQQAAQSIITDAIENAPEPPEIDPGITAGSFDIISQSLADLNNGFVDFLPNMAAARDELISLQTEVALTGITTEEQAAALEYLSSAALAVADDTGLLAEVTNGLGVAFLAANPEAAGLVDAMYQAQASYLSGAITADQYAGVLSVLGGQLLTLASQAGVATGSILQLIAAQGGLAGTGGFAQGQQIGGAITSRLQAQEGQRARDEARKAAQRAAKEAEAAAKRAAREQESAAKRAGKELESAAKKAAQELKSALDKVPGLFSRTKVTEQDMNLSKAGVYQDKADEYLRRLEAEVKEGKDIFADVSIDDARQSLTDLGVQVAEDNNVAFQQFVEAYESGLLFSDKANIEKYINKDAVERELELQKKAEEGRNNLYEAFGVAIDGAVEAAVGGISGGGGGGGVSGGVADLQIPITAALEPIPPITEKPTVTVQPYFDPVAWSKAIIPAQTVPVQPQMIGPQPKAGAPTGNLIDVASIQAQLDTLKLPAFEATAMGLADLQAQIDAFTPKPRIPVTVYSTIEALTDFATIVEMTAISVEPTLTATPTALSEMAVAVETQAQISIPVGLYAKLETMQELQTIVGATKVSVPVSLSTTDSEGNPSSDLALGLVGELNRQFSTNANFFYAAGQVPAGNVMDGYKGAFSGNTEGSPLVTPMITAINTQIRSQGESLQNQGITMAQYVQNGFTTAFNGESFKGAIIAAGETMGAYLEIGILSRIRGGALVEAIGAQVLADITAEVEAP